tara:strand:- start:4382 stop:4915 length:534 start_codon:yes stop_codon:yes gene_type:complete
MNENMNRVLMNENMNKVLINQSIKTTIITYVPIISIFIMGVLFPVKKREIRPIFQPPDWFFPIAWTYITLSFGFITSKFINSDIEKSKKRNLLVIYSVILIMLNGWLVLNHYNRYKDSFILLVITGYISIVYLIYMAYISSKVKKKYYIWFLLPLPFWLLLASCLNGVIYNNSKMIN